ncbi:MAG: PEGA domain-containing protein [Chlorobi bacterium]|nr:PEGA domain-containing protein [Chlorobiota bacterium]
MRSLKIKIALLLIIFAFFFAAGCNDEISSSKPEEFLENNMIFVDSNPQGAHIFLDGRNTAFVTPDTLKWLDVKSYDATLKMEYFRDTSFQITVASSNVNNIFIDYTMNLKMYGAVKFISTPSGADIYFDGIFTGKTTPDALLHVFPGEHVVIFELENYIPDTFMVYVYSSITTDAVSQLEQDSLKILN